MGVAGIGREKKLKPPKLPFPFCKKAQEKNYILLGSEGFDVDPIRQKADNE